ncbi:MAG: rod shape-determining protein MreC [Christensenellaceae bacterium]|jgi:rod shape-determining protein MreC|nr:rod shape-determining protein MreC [Christensenellaceae bacterium]
MNGFGGGSRKIFLIGAAAAACLLIALFGVSTTGLVEIPFVNSLVARVILPAQRAVSGLVNAGFSAAQQRRTQMELTQQLDELGEEKKLIEQDLLRMHELESENERLRALLNAAGQLPEYDLIAARVSGKEPGGWFESFTIDKGLLQGVSKDDVVLSAAGLVGRVLQVYDSSAVVMALIDSRSAAAALVERTRDNGVAQGGLYLTDRDELLQMHFLPAGAELQPGDRVISSGLDGIYPKGLFIGTVRSISRDQVGNERYVVLDPAADFSHLEEVLVMRLSPGGAAP